MAEIRKRIHRTLTIAERRRHDRIREEVSRDIDAVKSRGRIAIRTLDHVRLAVQNLKEKRQIKGISLGEVSARSGIDKGRLSKLENDPNANPTIQTLERIATAIGVRLKITVVESSA